MLTWVIYDISDDKTRRRVVKACKELGLYRVQKSVFLGDLESNRLDEVAEMSRELINEESDAVYIFPVCDEDYQKGRMVGVDFDKDLIANKVRDMVF